MLPKCAFPPYFNPEGIELPAHCGWHGRVKPVRVPAADAPGGVAGHCWGMEQYDPAMLPAWTRTAGGWWIMLAGHNPSSFLRMRTVDGPLIDGAEPGHTWMVPQLLRWHPTRKLISAVPEVLDNGKWTPPEPLIPLMEELRAMLLCTIDPATRLVDDNAAVELVIRLLAINYHIALPEISAAGWLNTTMMDDIVAAAGGVIEVRQRLAEAGK